MLPALTLPLAALVSLALGPSPASARLDRLPSHNMARRSPHAPGAPDHHAMADHLLHKRDALDDAVAAISGALSSSVVEEEQFEVGTALAGAAQVAPHQADLGSAYLLVSKASATSEAAAKKEGEEEKKLSQSKASAAAAKQTKARLARVAHSNSVASLKSASSVKKSKSIKAASKLKSARKAASSKSKSLSASASRARHSSAVAANASKATSSRQHASAVKASSKAKASAAKSKSKAAASKSKAEAKAAASKSSSTPKTTAVAKVAKVANTSKAGTILAGVFNLKGLKGFVATNACGASGATDASPNGAESWLNCGISTSNTNSGWTPPGGVTIDRLAYVSLETAMAENSVWAPCKPYVALFEKWGAATGLPPILLASFAMQESTCNKDESGDSGGAFGLMQITKDKCEGRDTAGCNDPDFNIGTGAKYFASQLVAHNGNVLLALGQYNGWYQGLTYAGATAAAYTGCCECQNNLDYMNQMLNGWLQGKTGYELGGYGNLDVCGE